MSEDLKAQIAISADATGVEAGVGRAKKSLADLGQAAAEAGAQGKTSLSGLGAGSEEAARKVDSSTKNLIGSIQRTIATMEAGSRSSSDFFKSIAQQRGVDVNALKPYLDQLDAVNAKQKAATVSTGQMGVSAAQTAAALRSLPAQISDIVVSLQSGQQPMTVLLQQGGQLKDMFGGVGNAARALGGYVLGLVNPVTIAIAALASLSYAAHVGGMELREFQNAATMSGGALGVSNSQFTTLRDNLAGIAGTRGKAAEVLTEIAREGRLAGDSIQAIGETAVLMEKAAGQAVSKTVSQFAELANAPLAASIKLNEQYNHLTVSVYRQIKALEDQGRVTEAAKLATDTFAETTKTRAAAVVENVGLIERAWRGVLDVIKKAGDTALNVGRQQSTAQQLAAVQGDIRAAEGRDPNRRFSTPWDTGLDELRAREASLQEQLRMEQRLAESEAARASQVKARSEFDKELDKHLPKRELMEREIAKWREKATEAGATDLELQKLIAGIRKGYAETGGQSEVAEIKARIQAEQQYIELLQKRIATLNFSDPVKLTEAEQRVLKIQEELKTSILGTARAEKEKALAQAQSLVTAEKTRIALERQYDAVKKSVEQYQDLIDATNKSADSIREQAIQQEAANAVWGKSKTAIEAATLAELKHRLAEADGSDSFDEKYVTALRAKVAEQERYVAALNKADFKALNEKALEYSRTISEHASVYADEARLAGLTSLERDKIVAVRKVELELAKRIADVDRSTLSDEEKSRLRADITATAEREKQQAVQKAVYDDWQKTTDQINQSLTDALMRGFESGKDFAGNLRDTVVNMFKTMVLRPVIQAVMSPVAGAMSNFIGGGSGGVLSAGANLFSGGGTSLGGLVGGGGMSLANSMGTAYANMTGGGLDALLATNGAYGTAGTASGGFMSGAASALPIVGWIAAGMALSGSLYDKGHRWDNSNTLADPGMTINTKALGALGIGGKTAAILTGSSILAAALDKLGIGGEERAGGAYTATSAGVRLNMGPSGGEIAGGDVRTAIAASMAETNAMLAAFGSAARVQQLQAGLESSRQGKGFVFAGGTLSTGAGFGVDLNGDYYNQHRGDLSAKDAVAKFQEQLEIAKLQALKAAGDLPKVFADQLASVDVSAMGSEARQSLVATFSSITANVQNFRVAVERLPFEYLRNKSFDAAAGLLEAAGGLDRFGANLSTYYDNFYSEEEKRQNSARNIATTLTAAGLSATVGEVLQMSKAQFRTLTEQYGAMGESGQRAYLALLSVNQEFASLSKSAGDVTVEIANARAALIQQYEQEQTTLRDTVSRLRDFAGGLRGFRDSLFLSGDLSPLTPQQQYTEAWRQFQDLKAKADAGDEGARQQLQGSAQSVLEAARTMFGSSARYVADFGAIQQALTDTATRASASADVAQLQLDAVTAMLDPLKSIDGNVATMSSALQAFQAAVQEAVAAGVAVSAADLAAASTGPTLTSVLHGSHAAGLDYVPFDGYRAELHQGETVFNRRASTMLRAFVGEGGAGGGEVVKILQAIEARLVQLEETVAAGDQLNAHATERNGVQVASAMRDTASRQDHELKLARKAAVE